MSGVFINLSNHPSDRWNAEQLDAAQMYGKVIDMPFPQIPSGMSRDEVIALAEETVLRIMQYDKPVVLVQGEFTFTYNVVQLLLLNHITALAACSDRRVVETVNHDGTTGKQVIFRFAGFRRY